MAEHIYSGFTSEQMQGSFKVLEYDLVDEKVKSIKDKVSDIEAQKERIKYLCVLAQTDILELEGNKILAKKLEVLYACYEAFLKRVLDYTLVSVIHSKSENKRNENLDDLKEKIELIKSREEEALRANQKEKDEYNSAGSYLESSIMILVPGLGTAGWAAKKGSYEQLLAEIASNQAEISSCNSDLAKIENLRAKGTN